MSNTTASMDADLSPTETSPVSIPTSAAVPTTSAAPTTASAPSTAPLPSSDPITTPSTAPSASVSTQAPSTTISLSTDIESTTTIPAESSSTLTSVISEPTPEPTTAVVTSVVTRSAENSEGSTPQITTVVVTSSSRRPTSTQNTQTTSSDTVAASSSAASLQGGGSSSSGSGGLNTAGRTAIAVVVPVVVVALLVLAGLFWWRRRKQQKNANQTLRQQVEDYNYNPNHDPTLPVIASDGHSEMTQADGHGYRGWGATNLSARKASTTLSGSHTQGQLSDSGSSPHNSGSPNALTTDDHSGDTLIHDQPPYPSDDLGALGAGPVAGNRTDMHRGKSNASSSYSAGNRSENSDGQYGSLDQYSAYPYGQQNPYGDHGMPVVRDVSARRNPQMQQGGGYQQGNGGIAQNF